MTLTQHWLEREIAKIIRIHIENFKIIIYLLVFVCVIPVTLTREIAKIIRMHIENLKIIIYLLVFICVIPVTPTQHWLEGRKEMFYLTTHSTHFIYSYMASDIW